MNKWVEECYELALFYYRKWCEEKESVCVRESTFLISLKENDDDDHHYRHSIIIPILFFFFLHCHATRKAWVQCEKDEHSEKVLAIKWIQGLKGEKMLSKGKRHIFQHIFFLFCKSPVTSGGAFALGRERLFGKNLGECSFLYKIRPQRKIDCARFPPPPSLCKNVFRYLYVCKDQQSI